MNQAGNEQVLRFPVEAEVWVDGKAVTTLLAYLKEIKVDMSRQAATLCTLRFDSIRNAAGDWEVQDAGIFAPWKNIKIVAYFGDYSEEVMRGFIREINVDYPQDMSSASVIVLAQDESILLDREHVRRTWSTEEEPVTDGDIVSRIAEDNNFQVQVEPGLTNTSLVNDSTYIKLLKQRAEANGYEIYIRSGTIYFHPPQLEGTPQAPIMIYAGAATNCLQFSANNDGHKPDRVRVIRSQDIDTNDDNTFVSNLSLLGDSAANSENLGLPNFEWLMKQPHGATSAELHSRAQAKANENAWKIVAKGELDGAIYGHVLVNYATVKVDGAGNEYDGIYYVDEVSHKFSAEGYRQEFKLLRNATGDSIYG